MDVGFFVITQSISMTSTTISDPNKDNDFVDPIVLVLVMIMLMLYVLSALTHVLEHRLRNNKFGKRVLSGLMHELSILGITEVFFFLLEKYMDINHSTALSIKHSHFAVFFAIVFYNLYLFGIGTLSWFVGSRRWEMIENMDSNHYLELRHSFHRISEQDGNKVKMTRRSYNRLLLQLRYHDLRAQFLMEHDLPKHFLVSKYLRVCLTSDLLDICGVKYYSYSLTMLLLLSFFVYDCVREFFESSFKADFDIISLVFAFGSLLVCTVLYWKIHRIFNVMLRGGLLRNGTEDPIRFQVELFWFGSPNKVKHAIQVSASLQYF